jgi:hypothetical protein
MKRSGSQQTAPCASKFAITHRFFVQAWEAILRHQIASFFAHKSSGQPFDVESIKIYLNKNRENILQNMPITRVWKYPI